jgi:hypothetical protein
MATAGAGAFCGDQFYTHLGRSKGSISSTIHTPS